MPIISVLTHHGGIPTLNAGYKLPSSASMSMAKPSSVASLVPDISPIESQTSGTLAKIFEIIGGMSGSKSEGYGYTNQNPSNNESAAARAYSKAVETANLTKDDVVEILKSNAYATRSSGGQSKAEMAMVEALKNGTATVTDLEDLGYKLEMSFNVHFDAAGNYTGGSQTYIRDYPEGVRSFDEEHLTRRDDGMFIDNETGDYGAVVQIGAIELYITWPKN